MGRLPLPLPKTDVGSPAMKSLCLAFALLVGAALAYDSPSGLGSFPERVFSAGKELSLNGVGRRTVTLFAITVYHAAFYADRSIGTLSEALEAPNPKRLDIRYVRNVDLEDTTDAWRFQFRESAGVSPPELTREIDALAGLLLPIKRGDVQRFDFEDGRTTFYVGSERRGEIIGSAFQAALLKIFFGPNPPTRDLQRGLTRGILKTARRLNNE